MISSERVPDDALLVMRDIIIAMLSARPDIRTAMIARKWRTGVIAETEMTSDIPEYRNNKRPGAPKEEPVSQADRDYHAWRSRGLTGNVKVDTPDEFKAYDPALYKLIGRVLDTHRIPMDVFHGKQVRPVSCS